MDYQCVGYVGFLRNSPSFLLIYLTLGLPSKNPRETASPRVSIWYWPAEELDGLAASALGVRSCDRGS
jgi:hypothetical protein